MTTLAFSADGTRLATGGDDGALRVWHLASGDQVAVQHAQGPVRFARWLHADRHVLYAHGWVSRLATWDTVTDQHFPLLDGATTDKSALSADGAVLVTTDNAAIRVWDVNGLREIASFTAAEPPVALATSPDGTTVAGAGAEGRIQLWDTASGAEQPSLLSRDIFNELAFSPDGAQLVAGGSSLVVWKLVPPEVRRELPGHTDSNVWCVAWTAAGLVVTGSSVLGWDADMLGGAVHPDRTVRTWSVEPPAELHRSMTLPADVSALATSADGRYVAAATSDGVVTIWTVPSA